MRLAAEDMKWPAIGDAPQTDRGSPTSSIRSPSARRPMTEIGGAPPPEASACPSGEKAMAADPGRVSRHVSGDAELVGIVGRSCRDRPPHPGRGQRADQVLDIVVPAGVEEADGRAAGQALEGGREHRGGRVGMTAPPTSTGTTGTRRRRALPISIRTQSSADRAVAREYSRRPASRRPSAPRGHPPGSRPPPGTARSPPRPGCRGPRRPQPGRNAGSAGRAADARGRQRRYGDSSGTPGNRAQSLPLGAFGSMFRPPGCRHDETTLDIQSGASVNRYPSGRCARQTRSGSRLAFRRHLPTGLRGRVGSVRHAEPWT